MSSEGKTADKKAYLYPFHRTQKVMNVLSMLEDSARFLSDH
jgi:hypothetical protein